LISETTRALVGSSLPDGVSVFPLGERHLKGLDEPERVYELEIEGMPARPDPVAEAAPTPGTAPGKRRPEADFEQRFEDFGHRLAAGIQERVLRSLEGTLGKVAGPAASSSDDEDVEDIAARAASLGDRLREQVAASLREGRVP